MTVQARAFVEAEKQAGGNVSKACDLLEVSRSAFYDWRSHTPSSRDMADTELAAQIRDIHEASGGTYGAPRVHAELCHRGVHVGRKRVARLMARAGVAGRCRRRSRRTTIPDPEAKALNLLGRHFGPENFQIDTVWCGDITYVRTWQGWAYLASVIDLASRRVVGWAIADHMESSLVCDAMRMALAVRRPAPGLIFHSDRGGQYCSKDFRALLDAHHATQSLSRPGQCWDNAVAESWFGTYKLELIEGRSWPTIARLRTETFAWIHGWYNHRRRHSALGQVSPDQYEQQHTHQPAATQAA
jgi:transposase InsO family protein